MPQNMPGVEALTAGQIFGKFQQASRKQGGVFQRPCKAFALHAFGNIGRGAHAQQYGGPQGSAFAPAERHSHAQTRLPEVSGKFGRQQVGKAGVRRGEQGNCGVHEGQSYAIRP